MLLVYIAHVLLNVCFKKRSEMNIGSTIGYRLYCCLVPSLMIVYATFVVYGFFLLLNEKDVHCEGQGIFYFSGKSSFI